MPLMFLQQLVSSVSGKFFKNYSKIHLESTKFENQCIKRKDVKIILLLFAISSETSQLWKK